MSEFSDRVMQQVPALRRYARALTGEHSAADDLVQDCLERALSRAHLWRRPDSLRGWLFAIMHNVHANHRRAAARRPQINELNEDTHSAVAPSQLDSVHVSQVAAAVGLLAEDQRRVLLLVALEGMKYEEVARLLGVPVGTVMSRLSRARDRLRELMRRGAPALRRVK